MEEARRCSERSLLLEAVAAVAPIARAHAPEAEERRTLSLPVVAALRERGLFALATPRELGGFEADPLTQLEVFEAMTRIDTSAGWGLLIGAMQAAMVGAYLPDAAVSRVFPGGARTKTHTPLIAGLLQPVGRAVAVEGGHRVEGRYPFGSGIRHAEWIFTSAIVAGAENAPPGPPSFVSVLVPREDVQVEDTWHVAGLRGSGSDHYVLRDTFVPSNHTCSFPAGARRRGGTAYDLPFVALLAPAHAAFVLGLARRALDEVAVLGAARNKVWRQTTLGETDAFRMDLGRAEAKLSAARAYALDALGACWDRVRSGAALGVEEMMHARLIVSHATDVAAEVVTFAYRSGGGSALYLTSPLQQLLRDVFAATQHVAATDDAFEHAGKVRLGLPVAHPLLAPRALPFAAAP